MERAGLWTTPGVKNVTQLHPEEATPLWGILSEDLE